MIFESTYELRQGLKGSVVVHGDKVEVVTSASPPGHRHRPARAYRHLWHRSPVKDYARWMIWKPGQELGARPASIHEFYIARGRTSGRTSHRARP